MTLEHLLGDHPSPEQQIAAIVTALSKHIEYQQERDKRLEDKADKAIGLGESLVLLQREQNSNVANLTLKAEEHKKWINIHDDWHGDADKKIAARVREQELENAKKEGVIDFLKGSWTFAGALVAAGLLIGKLLNEFDFWTLIGLE